MPRRRFGAFLATHQHTPDVAAPTRLRRRRAAQDTRQGSRLRVVCLPDSSDVGPNIASWCRQASN